MILTLKTMFAILQTNQAAHIFLVFFVVLVLCLFAIFTVPKLRERKLEICDFLCYGGLLIGLFLVALILVRASLALKSDDSSPLMLPLIYLACIQLFTKFFVFLKENLD